MFIAGRMEPRKLPTYLVAQFVGAFIAGWVLLGIFGDSITGYEAFHRIVRGTAESVNSASLFGEYFPNPSAPPAIAILSKPMAALVEAVGTFILVTIIFFLPEDCNVGRPSRDIAPVFIGLTVMGIISLLAPLTQAGLNPPRGTSVRGWLIWRAGGRWPFRDHGADF